MTRLWFYFFLIFPSVGFAQAPSLDPVKRVLGEKFEEARKNLITGLSGADRELLTKLNQSAAAQKKAAVTAALQVTLQKPYPSAALVAELLLLLQQLGEEDSKASDHYVEKLIKQTAGWSQQWKPVSAWQIMGYAPALAKRMGPLRMITDEVFLKSKTPAWTEFAPQVFSYLNDALNVELVQGNYPRVAEIGRKLKGLSLKGGLSLELYRTLGRSSYRTGDLSESVGYYQECAAKGAAANTPRETWVECRKDLIQSLRWAGSFEKSNELAETLKNEPRLKDFEYFKEVYPLILLEQVKTLKEMSRFKEAQDMANESLKLIKKDNYFVAWILLEASDIQRLTGNFKKAKEYLQRTEKEMREESTSSVRMWPLLMSARIARAEHNMAEAAQKVTRAQQLAELKKPDLGITLYYVYLEEVVQGALNKKPAREAFQKALAIFKGVESQHQARIQLLSAWYELSRGADPASIEKRIKFVASKWGEKHYEVSFIQEQFHRLKK
jgi:hypothetical protein